MGTWIGAGNDPRYTPTTTFETFPFPYTPGQEPTGDPIYQRISRAADQLNKERDAWLNPADEHAGLKGRTLTNLYNALETYRTRETSQAWHTLPNDVNIKEFAPKLAELHAELDSAVLAAYGWSDLDGKLRTPDGDEELLRRLLALNLQRAGSP